MNKEQLDALKPGDSWLYVEPGRWGGPPSIRRFTVVRITKGRVNFSVGDHEEYHARCRDGSCYLIPRPATNEQLAIARQEIHRNNVVTKVERVNFSRLPTDVLERVLAIVGEEVVR